MNGFLLKKFKKKNSSSLPLKIGTLNQNGYYNDKDRIIYKYKIYGTKDGLGRLIEDTNDPNYGKYKLTLKVRGANLINIEEIITPTNFITERTETGYKFTATKDGTTYKVANIFLFHNELYGKTLNFFTNVIVNGNVNPLISLILLNSNMQVIKYCANTAQPGVTQTNFYFLNEEECKQNDFYRYRLNFYANRDNYDIKIGDSIIYENVMITETPIPSVYSKYYVGEDIEFIFDNQVYEDNFITEANCISNKGIYLPENTILLKRNDDTILNAEITFV